MSTSPTDQTPGSTVRRFPNWWANQKTGKRPKGFAWMAAGWLVSKVDVDANLVKFSRQNIKRGGKN